MGDSANAGNEVAVVPTSIEVRDLIYVVRGKQVMLDSDLAELYGVETGALNRAAKRNEDRFPEDFRFQVTKDELENLKCQNGISSSGPGYGGRRTLPYAYTEHGIAMLAGVLRSEVARQVSISIIRAFVEMRHFLAGNAKLFEQVREIELRQMTDQARNEERFEQVFGYIEGKIEPAQRIFFDGQIYDAFSLLTSLVEKAEREIVLVDGYVDVGTLNILAKKGDGVAVTLYTRGGGRLSRGDIDAFNAQYPPPEVHRTDAFHDRFLILDGKTAYHIGASLKDAGKKAFAITLIEDDEMVEGIMARLGRISG